MIEFIFSEEPGHRYNSQKGLQKTVECCRTQSRTLLWWFLLELFQLETNRPFLVGVFNQSDYYWYRIQFEFNHIYWVSATLQIKVSYHILSMCTIKRYTHTSGMGIWFMSCSISHLYITSFFGRILIIYWL